LVDSCKHIYADKNWNDNRRCKACITEIKTSLAPLFHLHYNVLLATDEKSAYYFLRCLFQLADRLFRPFDFISAKVSWERLPTDSVTELLEDAFVIGASVDTYKIWERELS
jgi:hypothetical protein